MMWSQSCQSVVYLCLWLAEAELYSSRCLGYSRRVYRHRTRQLLTRYMDADCPGVHLICLSISIKHRPTSLSLHFCSEFALIMRKVCYLNKDEFSRNFTTFPQLTRIMPDPLAAVVPFHAQIRYHAKKVFAFLELKSGTKYPTT